MTVTAQPPDTSSCSPPGNEMTPSAKTFVESTEVRVEDPPVCLSNVPAGTVRVAARYPVTVHELGKYDPLRYQNE
jgi:hypothetical protein